MDGGDETSLVNVINNYYKPGPGTNENMRGVFARIESRDMYSPGSAWAAGDWYAKVGKRPGKWYVAGNVMHDNQEVTNNNWNGMRGPEKLARVNTPFEGWPVAPFQTAEDAFESVLAKAGATLPKRDAVDARVTEMVRTGKTTTATGLIKDISEVGGYPTLTYKPSEVLVDTDGDGMPDEWEKRYGLNPNDPSDGAIDSDGDGYTNVEEYLNGTNPKEKIDYRNLGNNVDTIS